MIEMRTVLVNEDANMQFADFPETFDDPEDLPSFRDLQREWGRCKGKVYLDTISRGTIATGWVFESRREYEGRARWDRWGNLLPPETYIQETWVTFYEVPEQTALRAMCLDELRGRA